MQRFIIGRVVQSIVSMFVVSVVVFALVRLSGDPIQIMMPAEASKADIELVRAHLGLDRPWTVQYWRVLAPAPPGGFGWPGGLPPPAPPPLPAGRWATPRVRGRAG